MASGTGTNVALRTMVMIGALLVLLLMALLPGPVGWLVGGGRAGETQRDPPPGGGERSARDLAATIEHGTDLAPDLVGNVKESSWEAAKPDATEPEKAPTKAEAPPSVAVGETGGADDSQSITAQLRQEGAAYYRLESWESEPRVFRFQCTMPVGEAQEGAGQDYRTFEAAGSDPSEAMQRVLADVRAWNASGRY